MLLDAVLQLRALTSLRLSLHSNLLSCVLNQAQLNTLATQVSRHCGGGCSQGRGGRGCGSHTSPPWCVCAQVRGLRSLWLSGLLLPDTDAAWRCLGALTALTELRVSAPFHAKHLG